MTKRTAFTLAEFTMAMAITAIVGLSVAAVSAALGGAYAQSEEFYVNLQSARCSMLMVQAAVRNARLVTATDANTAVFWQDADDDGAIDQAELTALTLVGGKLELHGLDLKRASADVAAALNVPVTLADVSSATAVNATLCGSAYGNPRVLADDVRDFRVTPRPAAPLTRMLEIQVTVGKAPHDVTLRSAVTMRADLTGAIGVVNDQYVLGQ